MVLIEAAVPASFLVLTPSPGEANVPIDAAVAASSLALAPALGAGIVLIAAAVPASFLALTPAPGVAGLSSTITLDDGELETWSLSIRA